MSTAPATDRRADVVAHGHGDHEPIPPGPERDAIDAVRFLAADAVERAGSGHPGTAMATYRLGASDHPHQFPGSGFCIG